MDCKAFATEVVKRKKELAGLMRGHSKNQAAIWLQVRKVLQELGEVYPEAVQADSYRHMAERGYWMLRFDTHGNEQLMVDLTTGDIAVMGALEKDWPDFIIGLGPDDLNAGKELEIQRKLLADYKGCAATKPKGDGRRLTTAR